MHAECGKDILVSQGSYCHWVVIVNIYCTCLTGDCGSTVVKVLRYKSEGRWFDPSWCQWISH